MLYFLHLSLEYNCCTENVLLISCSQNIYKWCKNKLFRELVLLATMRLYVHGFRGQILLKVIHACANLATRNFHCTVWCSQWNIGCTKAMLRCTRFTLRLHNLCRVVIVPLFALVIIAPELIRSNRLFAYDDCTSTEWQWICVEWNLLILCKIIQIFNNMKIIYGFMTQISVSRSK